MTQFHGTLALLGNVPFSTKSAMLRWMRPALAGLGHRPEPLGVLALPPPVTPWVKPAFTRGQQTSRFAQQGQQHAGPAEA